MIPGVLKMCRHFSFKKTDQSQAPTAHGYNPSYSGGKDEEDRGLKSAQTNTLRPCLKNIQHKKRLAE
jgi:hypothetical protein